MSALDMMMLALATPNKWQYRFEINPQSNLPLAYYPGIMYQDTPRAPHTHKRWRLCLYAGNYKETFDVAEMAEWLTRRLEDE